MLIAALPGCDRTGPTAPTSGAAGLAADVVGASGAVYVVNFEEGSHLEFINPDGAGLIVGTPIRFPPQYEWRYFDGTTTSFIANIPSGHFVAFWTGQNFVSVRFDEPVAGIRFCFVSVVDLDILANDVAGAVVGMSSSPANLQPDGFTRWDPIELEASANLIKEVRLQAGANATVIDDFKACVLPDRPPPTTTPCSPPPPPLVVAMDVKPGNGDDIDPINLKSQGSLPVAVFSSADFDATALDLATLELGDPVLTPRAHVIHSAVEDVDQDGRLDLVMHFSAVELVDGAAINSATTDVVLTGNTTAGVHVTATDPVRIVGH